MNNYDTLKSLMQIKKLIKQANSGRSGAQRALYDLTCAQLNSVALRYVVERSLAEDVLQESYIRIFKSLKSFDYRDDRSTLAWMKRITVTESLRLLKKRKRWTTADQSTTTELTITTDYSATGDITAALSQLSDRQRIVFNMYALEGFNHDEIAIHLGIAASSSRALLSRARSILKTTLTKRPKYEHVR